MPILLFSDLNLRFNPFGELTNQERIDLSVVDVEEFRETLLAPKKALQFVAPHGHGKTTHLLKLSSYYSSFDYLRAYPDEPFSKPIATKLFIDSFDVISFRQRQHILKRSQSIAITCHEDMTCEFEREGFSVSTRIVKMASADDIVQVLNKRIEYARRAEGSVPIVSRDDVLLLQKKYQSNIRAMESELYLNFQNRKNISYGQM